jgi:hypothetical protein
MVNGAAVNVGNVTVVVNIESDDMDVELTVWDNV